MAEIKVTAGVDSFLEDLVRTRMTVREIELLPGQIELSEAQEQSFAAALGGAMLGAFLRKNGRELVLDWRAIGDRKESTIEAHRMVSQVSATGRIGLPVAASHASIKVGAIDGMLREADAGFPAGREIEDLLPKALEQAEVASVGDAAKVSASRVGGWLVGTHESADPDALSMPSRRRQKVRGAFTDFHAQTRPEPPQTERNQEAEAARIDFVFDDMAQGISPRAAKSLFFDPENADAEHAERFLALGVRCHAIPFSGHPSGALLHRLGLLARLQLELAADPQQDLGHIPSLCVEATMVGE